MSSVQIPAAVVPAAAALGNCSPCREKQIAEENLLAQLQGYCISTRGSEKAVQTAWRESGDRNSGNPHENYRSFKRFDRERGKEANAEEGAKSQSPLHYGLNRRLIPFRMLDDFDGRMKQQRIQLREPG